MATIKGIVGIDAEGNPLWEITEAQGPNCRSAMQPLVDALGGEEDVVLKPEYHAGAPMDLAVEGPQTIQASI